jgi:hypothetical protein
MAYSPSNNNRTAILIGGSAWSTRICSISARSAKIGMIHGIRHDNSSSRADDTPKSAKLHRFLICMAHFSPLASGGFSVIFISGPLKG